MAWKTIINPGSSRTRRKRRVNMSANQYGGYNSWSGTVDNFNMLQQVYRGRYDRIERYRLYDWMDQDSDVARALDIIAEHTSEKNDEDHFFEFKWSVPPTEEESSIVQECLTQWSQVNEWDNRLWRVTRNVVKYGDWFFFRNPETFELYSIHPKFVLGALVHRQSLEIIGWIIRNFKFNVENLELSVDDRGIRDTIRNMSLNTGLRNTSVIPSIHIAHLSLSEGKFAGSSADDDPSDKYNNRWPFGESKLEQVSKTFKQRELVEDSALIHRVQRAPSRTIWYIDTGKMRGDRSSWAVHNFKNELNQKRIPQFVGGEQKTVDSVYNPISQLEDIYIPVSFDQRGSKVEQLEGDNWDNLPELEHFNKKIMSALRVPRSWMLGSNESGALFSDARVGVAYQEEIEFSRFCRSIQVNITNEFDLEFKIYCKIRDIDVSPADHKLIFVEPDNYEDYKRNARDQDNINTWSQIKDDPTISKRFARIKYLNWTEDEVVKNERMLIEEKGSIEEAGAAEDILGGGGGLGALPLPPGGGESPLGNMAGGELPGTTEGGGFSDLGGATAADFGGGGLAMTGTAGAPTGAGGFGESESENDMKFTDLFETELTSKDIEPEFKKLGIETGEETPDDKLFGGNGKYGGSDAPHGHVVATLALIRDIRKTNFSRKIENRKRLKLLQKIYNPPEEEAGGLGGGGLGGGLGGI